MINKRRFPISFFAIAFLTALLLAAPSVHASKKGEEGGGAEGKSGGFVQMEPIIVNLASDNGKRLLKITIQLEPARAETAQEISSRQPQVIDALITVLSSKTADGLLTVEGKARLKEQILGSLNNIVTGGVKSVYFVEFVIQ